MLYDVDTILKELHLPDQEKEDLVKELREEFPQDEMLFELHLYRAAQFLKKQKKDQ
ncbi:MAG: hypothetical protein R6U96_19330 [Promethearchaeia archaeon]